MNFKKLVKFICIHYIFFLIVIVVAFVIFFSVSKVFLVEPKYIYVRVKVGQGFWWASTAKPTIWFANSIKKGEKQFDLLGKPTAEIEEVRYYPTWGTGQYDVFIKLKLKASYNSRSQTYSFSRSTISIGSPIEIQFPSTFITGTVIALSNFPIEDEYVEKIIYLVYQEGYRKDFPYRYDNIKIGDKYFDGSEEVFKVEDKSLENNILSIENNLTAQVFERMVETTQNIIVKAKVKLKNKNGELFYGEDYKVSNNTSVPFSTKDYFFENFVVRKIED